MLHKACRKLFGKTVELSEQTSGTGLPEIINDIPGSDCEFEEVTEWIKSDAEDHGFQILTDQEIVDSIQEEDKSGEEEDKEENDESTAPHSEAFNTPETGCSGSTSRAAELLTLKRLRDLSAGKRVSSAKQTSLLDFLK
jgi:hypothetical protein